MNPALDSSFGNYAAKVIGQLRTAGNRNEMLRRVEVFGVPAGDMTFRQKVGTCPAMCMFALQGSDCVFIDGASTREQISAFIDGASALPTVQRAGAFNEGVYWATQNALGFIEDNRQNKRGITYLCGWSLGGCIATVAALLFASRDLSARYVTFGAPRCVNSSTAGRLNLGPVTGVRWMNTEDTFCVLPPRWEELPLLCQQHPVASLFWQLWAHLYGGQVVAGDGRIYAGVTPPLGFNGTAQVLLSGLWSTSTLNVAHSIQEYERRLALTSTSVLPGTDNALIFVSPPEAPTLLPNGKPVAPSPSTPRATSESMTQAWSQAIQQIGQQLSLVSEKGKNMPISVPKRLRMVAQIDGGGPLWKVEWMGFIVMVGTRGACKAASRTGNRWLKTWLSVNINIASGGYSLAVSSFTYAAQSPLNGTIPPINIV